MSYTNLLLLNEELGTNKKRAVYNPPVQQAVLTRNLPLHTWWNWYSKALFILACFWNPKTDSIQKENGNSMYCFLTSLFKLLPNEHIRRYTEDFLRCEGYVLELLKEECGAFFTVYPHVMNTLEHCKTNKTVTYPFLTMCLSSSSTLFVFLYLYQSFILIYHNKQGHNIQIPHYTQMLELYNIHKINKYDWGRPIWFILHTVSLYGGPSDIHTTFKEYKQMLTCLQYLLPCTKCRTHLSNNLTKISIDTCAKTREDLFKCSWELHNIVNKDTNKPVLSLSEAFSIYQFKTNQ